MLHFYKAIPALLLSCVTLLSCVEEANLNEEEVVSGNTSSETSVLTRSSSIKKYEPLPNPYALEVMQEVYDIYSETQETLRATDLYVKFMPKDSLELYRLKYDYNLELFDYPLDIALDYDEVYLNPELPESDLMWVYTTVKPNFVFPPGISYEILEECYIPEADEMVGAQTRAGVVYVEDAAFALLGYNETAFIGTRAASTPQGTIRVYDNDSGLYVPVKGVKVRCHRWVKWTCAYTDENGFYKMNNSFRYQPHYALVFENVKDFDIWGNWGPFARANYNMGWQSSSGYSENIKVDSDAWHWAVVNNAAYDYYNMCEQTGILKPPAKLKIWVWSKMSGSAAPMLRRISDAIGYNGNSSISNFFINMFYGMPATLLNQTLKVLLPDITIGPNYINRPMKYIEIYDTVNHELAHASHFSKVGSSFWAKYISYIMTYGAYGGNDSGRNAQLCAIGEMWGFFMGYEQAAERFGTMYKYLYSLDTVDNWIFPQVFDNLFSNNILTKRQIYDCLTPEVDTYNGLVSKLYTLYPGRATDIKSVFDNYPAIKHNVDLPETDDVVLENRTITSSTTISGENILVQNSTVSNGATLILNAGTSITINRPFTVEKGSTLLMTKGN